MAESPKLAAEIRQLSSTLLARVKEEDLTLDDARVIHHTVREAIGWLLGVERQVEVE